MNSFSKKQIVSIILVFAILFACLIISVFTSEVYAADDEIDNLETDTTLSVRVSAVDVASGAEVEGATLQILNNNEVVKEWTSTSESFEVTGLNSDVEYKLISTVPPDGYTLSTDTTFILDTDGRVTSTGTITDDDNPVLLVEFEKTHVEVKSVKEADASTLSDVTIQIKDDNSYIVEEWSSSSSNHIIEGLIAGKEYTMIVTVVPDSSTYDIPTETKFTISENGNVTSTGSIDTNGVMIVEIPNKASAISTWAELQTALNAGGTVTLTQDIVAGPSDTTLNVPGTVTLDLNGYIIDGNGYATPVIRTKDYSGNLTINDSNPTRAHSPAFTYKNPITNGDVVVTGGIITGGKDGNWGNGIDVPRSTVTMNGGSIVKNTTSTGNGAGVFVHSAGTFNMNGGLIAGNHSEGSGGGVYLYDRTTFNMTGGTVKHNSATMNGGGFYLWNNQAGYYDVLNMSGGRIEENKSTGNGGGICIDTRGIVNFSGNPVVIGNKKGDTNNNVYGTFGFNGALTNGASIGVTTAQSPLTYGTQTFTGGYSDYNNGKDPSEFFVSDIEGAIVTLDFRNEACLVATYNVTVTNDGNGTASSNPTSGPNGTEITLTATPTDADNYRFKEWQVISGGVTVNSENKFTMGSSNVEIKAIFEEIPMHTVTFKDGDAIFDTYTQQVKDGEYASEPSPAPTKEGFRFLKWCADSTVTTEFVFTDNPITSDTFIYAKWEALPRVVGNSVWRTASDTATIRFYSQTAGTYYYVVSNSSTAPSAAEIKSASTGVHGSAATSIGTNPINLTGLSAGAQYLYIVVEKDGTFSNVLTIEMPYDVYFFDNYDSYPSNTGISGLNSYRLQYDGTGSGNQKIISSEQKDGTTGNVLQLQGRNSWASDVRHNFTPDNKQYVIFEANVKSVSGSDPGGVNFASSSAGGSWTGSVCRAGLGLNGKFYYGKNDNSEYCDTDLTHSNGNWYNLKMILDNAHDFYYISINNQFINTIQYEADPATPEWFSIGAGNNGTNTIYYDDVKVYTTDTVDIPAPTYKITVNNGSSSPNTRAEENATVTITADEAPNGAEFYKWVVNSGDITLSSDTSSTTTFTMGTQNVEVTAMYKYIVEGQIAYELRDSYGDGWHGNNNIIIEDVSDNSIVETLTIPSGSSLDGITKNLEPFHIYNLRWEIGSWPGECSFTLKDLDGNVLITRNGSDNSSKAGVFLTIQVEEQRYSTIVNNGSYSPNTKVKKNTTVTITADEAPNGAEFYKWIVLSGGITLSSDTSSTTTFTMGTENVEVTALYKYLVDDQITYELRDSYGDSWHGNNKIIIEDASNNSIVETLTIQSGSSLNGTTQNLEPGHIYNLRWEIGSWPGECSFTLKDADGNVLITRNGSDNSSKEGIFLGIQFKVTECTVTFNPNGGIVDPTSKVVTKFDTYGELPLPSKDPSTFVGWFEEIIPYGADQCFNDRGTYVLRVTASDTLDDVGRVPTRFNVGDIVSFDITLFDATITGLDINDRSVASSDYTISSDGKNITGKILITNSNYHYLYDFIDLHLSNETNDYNINSFNINKREAKSDTVYKYSTDITLYAGWIDPIAQYTVSFNTNGGSTVESQTVMTGRKATIPSKPTKEGYGFDGWYIDNTYSSKFDFNTVINTDVTLYAKWVKNQDAVIELTDGMNVSDVVITDDNEMVIEALVERELLIIETSEDGKTSNYYNSDNKLLFTVDENGKITFADGISSADNIVVELTDDERQMFEDDGIFINNLVLSFASSKFEYVILEGANQTYVKGSGTGLRIKANGLLSKLVEMRKNGKKIESGCDLTSGSTIATLSPEYLDSLELGTYKLTFVYVDGEVSTNFTIAQADTPAGGGGESVAGETVTLLSGNPLTGDNIIIYVIILIIAVNCFIATEIYIKKVFNKK